MIEIKIHKEITDYKEKWWNGLTLRQTLCVIGVIATLLIVITTWFFLLGINPVRQTRLAVTMFDRWKDVLIPVSLIPSIIFVLIGWLEINAMTFEKLIVQYYKFATRPNVRKYKNINLYTYLKEEE